MWLQRKIMTNIHKDKLFYDLDAAIGWERLVDDIAAFSAHPELTALIPPLDGIDPDDSFSSVPYEKGQPTYQYSSNSNTGLSRIHRF